MKTIERLRELEKAATPVYAHPTELEHDTADGKCGDVRIWEKNIPGVCVAVFRNRNARATADHYIATRNALPALLAVVEAQAAEIALCRYCVEPDPVYGWSEPRHLQDCEQEWHDLGKARTTTDDAIKAMEGGVS